jgi:hypothetical protein
MLNPFTHRCHRLTLLLLRLLEHLLDDLLLLDQESADDAVLDAAGAPRSTVRTLDGLLGAGNLGVLAGAEGRNTLELGTAVLQLVNNRLQHPRKPDLHRTWGQCPSS